MADIDTMMDGSDTAAVRSALPGHTPPFARFEWMLARRYLGSRRKETFISVISVISFIGIMLGVGTLIVVMAVMNGFRAELLDRILGINGHIIVQPVHSELTDYDAVARRIEGVGGVTLALPLIEGEVLASGGRGGSGARVRGIRENDLKRMAIIADNIREGTLDGFDAAGSAEEADAEEVVVDVDGTITIAGDDEDEAPQAGGATQRAGVAIGTRMAANLGLALGDSITLITPEGDVSAFGVSPRVKSYPVTAIFEMGMAEFDNLFVFMPLSEAQLYFNQEKIVSAIEIFVEDPDAVDAMRPEVEQAAQRPVLLSDWRGRNRTLVDALDVERNVMFIILTLILLVAALNIVSGLFMLVKDKGSDVAILRTMGTTRASVMRIFLITGSSIGVFGTIMGVAAGLLFCSNINAVAGGIAWMTGANIWDPAVRYLTEIPVAIDPFETTMVVLMALGLSLLATIFPAWRAARLDPVEALRYE